MDTQIAEMLSLAIGQSGRWDWESHWANYWLVVGEGVGEAMDLESAWMQIRSTSVEGDMRVGRGERCKNVIRTEHNRMRKEQCMEGISGIQERHG